MLTVFRTPRQVDGDPHTGVPEGRNPMSTDNPRLLEMVSRTDRDLRIRRAEQVAEQRRGLATDERTPRWRTAFGAVAHSLNRAGARLAAAGSGGFLGHGGGPPQTPHPR
jgi:hypothetical protein